MTSLIEGAKKLDTRGTDIGNRVKGLGVAVAAARGRLDDSVLDPAGAVVDRATDRLRLSADHTVVALGGATGSGKSSTFNALVGLDLASVGVRRPTTSWATACTWGVNGASELLEWLGIPARHQVVRDSMLDTGREKKDLEGLVLLDMPDHDSTEVSHHLEVERLVRLADLLIWVLDPQKYADAAIHDRFLKPLAAHKGVMLIVLNHIDEVAEDRRAGMIADLRRLLDADGLDGITLIATSAREGIGIDELRSTITARVADKAATRSRIATDVHQVASAISAVSGSATPVVLTPRDQSELREAMAEAAGVPVVVQAVHKATLIRARRATGWPLTSWLSRFRTDPLEGLDLGAAGDAIPDADQVQHPRIDSAVRDLADQLSRDLTRPWATALSRAATARLPEVQDRLSRAVGSTDLGVDRIPVWSRLVQAVQWLLLVAAVVGGLWWAALRGFDALPFEVSEPEVAGLSLPLALAIGGVGAGLLLAVLCRLLVSRSATGRAQRADVRLRTAVNEVTEELVIGPLTRELDAYRSTTEGLRTALA